MNAARERIPETKGLPIHVAEFKFAPLERVRLSVVGSDRHPFFLVDRHYRSGGGGFRYTELESDGGIPFAMQAVDLDGDGVDELVTGIWPAGYLGATTPPIFWYTVWQFHDGVPEDASARFPDFYRSFVLGQLWYPEKLLRDLAQTLPFRAAGPVLGLPYRPQHPDSSGVVHFSNSSWTRASSTSALLSCFS